MPTSTEYRSTIVLKRVRTERRRLEANLAKLNPEDMLIPGVVDQWSVKDVIAHCKFTDAKQQRKNVLSNPS